MQIALNYSNKKVLLIGAGIVVFALYFIAMQPIAKKYAYLKDRARRTEVLEQKLSQQKERLLDIDQNIGRLRSELLALHRFESQIRDLSNFEKESLPPQEGAGGPRPQDLNAVPDPDAAMFNEILQETTYLYENSQLQQKSFSELFNRVKAQHSLLSATPSIRPAKGWISSTFGRRSSPFSRKREFHKGLDIAARRKTPIYATADGLVVFAGNKGPFGKMVVIDHGYGYVTRYGHCCKLLIEKGDRVKRGQKIALMGSTGRSTGPHVHYEVYLNSVAVNPWKYILN